jgi:hypothetical protein
VSACCARCGRPGILEWSGKLDDWRGLRLCDDCWVVMEKWALYYENTIWRMVRANDAARENLRRGTGYY